MRWQDAALSNLRGNIARASSPRSFLHDSSMVLSHLVSRAQTTKSDPAKLRRDTVSFEPVQGGPRDAQPFFLVTSSTEMEEIKNGMPV